MRIIIGLIIMGLMIFPTITIVICAREIGKVIEEL